MTAQPTIQPNPEPTIPPEPTIQPTSEPTVQSEQTIKPSSQTTLPPTDRDITEASATSTEVTQETNENTADETQFFECETTLTEQSDSQSTDSESSEIAGLTNDNIEDSKPRKLISPVVQRISYLHEQALDIFMKDYKCGIKQVPWPKLKTSKAKKIERINEWIKTNHPDWETDSEGYYLIKHDALMLDKKCYLSSFTLVELKVLSKHIGLNVDTEHKPKTLLLSEITRKTKEKFPFMKTTPSGNLIIDPLQFI